MKKISLMAGLLFMLSFGSKAQILGPVKWSYAAKKLSVNEAVVYLKAVIQNGWHIYSINQKPGGPLKTSFTFNVTPDFALKGKVLEPQPLSKLDEAFGIQVDYFDREVVFQQKIALKKAKIMVRGKLEFMACTDTQCLTPTEVEFSIPVK